MISCTQHYTNWMIKLLPYGSFYRSLSSGVSVITPHRSDRPSSHTGNYSPVQYRTRTSYIPVAGKFGTVQYCTVPVLALAGRYDSTGTGRCTVGTGTAPVPVPAHPFCSRAFLRDDSTLSTKIWRNPDFKKFFQKRGRLAKKWKRVETRDKKI